MTSTTAEVQGFYHPSTNSVAYVVADPATRQAAIIDPVLDFEPESASIGTDFADRMLSYVKDRNLRLQWILDTHPHADHLSAAAHLKERTGVPTGIGEKVVEVQKLWRDIYGYGEDFPADGRYWDRLFADGEEFPLGELPVRVMHCPGHTLASITYVVGDCAFVHDTLLMPDFGTARADFPGGSAAMLHDSIQAILALPETTRVFVGHDYQPGGREPAWESTVAEQRRDNVHLQQARDKGAYVALRESRDRGLPLPTLMLHALQVNIRGGRLPEAEPNGRHYLKIPVGFFDA